MKCKDCDFIKEDYDRISRYYKDKCYEVNNEEIVRECYCQKVGGKISHFGYCSECNSIEEMDNVEPTTKVNKRIEEKLKARKRRFNTNIHKRKLKWQARNITSYPTPAYGVDNKGNYTDNEDEIVYYKETNKSSHCCCYSFWKKQTNRKVRKLPIMEGSESKQKGLYKKVQKGYVD